MCCFVFVTNCWLLFFISMTCCVLDALLCIWSPIADCFAFFAYQWRVACLMICFALFVTNLNGCFFQWLIFSCQWCAACLMCCFVFVTNYLLCFFSYQWRDACLMFCFALLPTWMATRCVLDVAFCIVTNGNVLVSMACCVLDVLFCTVTKLNGSCFFNLDDWFCFQISVHAFHCH